LDRQAAVKAVNQHRAILEALLARDRTAARKALIAHLRHGHPVLKTDY
jgi:DNA-binding GntR family transcriptional regulator